MLDRKLQSLKLHDSAPAGGFAAFQQQQEQTQQQQQLQVPHHRGASWGGFVADDVQVAGMRCVLCGGPFRGPTAQDQALFHLIGAPKCFRWLSSWKALWADPDLRKRGQPAAFWCHRDCCLLVQQQLGIPRLRFDHIWPCIKEHIAPCDMIPDGLPAESYQGMDAVLNPNGNRTSCTVLSAGFRDKDAWMLHSPLACTKNATRVLSIWSPKLTHGSGLRTLITQRLANWRLALQARLQQGAGRRSSGPDAPPRRAAPPPGTPRSTAAAAPDLLTILLQNPSMHDPLVLAKLHLASQGMAVRIATALNGRLRLRFSTTGTESALSFALWLTKHAGLMAALDVSVQVCCCNEDAAAADAALTDAMQQAATAAPACVMRAFGTSCSKPRLLTPGMGIATRLQRLLHIGLPDITSQQQLSCLPRQLHSLCLLQCSMSAQLLQQLARQCPSLRDVRLAYSMYPSKQHKGPELLDRACAGWTLVPLVDLQFEGRRLPRGMAIKLPAETPYMSAAVLAQLPLLSALTRLAWSGCCVDAPLSQVVAVLGQLKALRVMQMNDTGGILTAAAAPAGVFPDSKTRAFVDSTAALLQTVQAKAQKT